MKLATYLFVNKVSSLRLKFSTLFVNKVSYSQVIFLSIVSLFFILLLIGMESKDHPLSLKVMRLSRPSPFTAISVNSERRDLPHEILEKEMKDDLTIPWPDTGIGQVLILPQSFGNIYLGEMFRCCVCVHNGSKERYDVSIKADLQMNNQTVSLLESESVQLSSDNFIDRIVHHEVKEIGTHILVCSVSYRMGEMVEQSFRKFFRFQVLKPLDVKTKFYNAESDEVYLEAAIQNITAGPIFLENVALDPSPYYTVKSLNNIIDEGSDTQSIFGEVRCLSAQDIFQYLFCLQPGPQAENNIANMKQTSVIGKLDIVWRSNMGDRGRLQTSQLQRMILPSQYGDVKVCVESIPSIVRIEEPFDLTVKIINISNKDLSLYVEFCGGGSATEWHRVSSQRYDRLEPNEATAIPAQIMPLKPGLQMIAGLRLTDTFLKRTYDYDNLAQVFVITEMSNERKDFLREYRTDSL